MRLLSNYELFHALIKQQIRLQSGSKVITILDISRKMKIDCYTLLEIIGMYIHLNGGQEIELNSDLTKVRIYGKK